jgi:hypothetical protein
MERRWSPECTCSPKLNRAASPVQPLPRSVDASPVRCSTAHLHRTQGVDIHVEVPRVPFQKLSDERRGEPSAAIRARVEAARARQSARFANVKDGQGASLTTNADIGPTQVRDHCPVDETGRQLLGAAMQRLRPGDEPERAGVSPRAEAGADDRRPGRERRHPAGAHRRGDPPSVGRAGKSNTWADSAPE